MLFTLLVLTGFAGSIHSGSMTGKERRTLVADLKETRNAFFKSVEDLTPAQLNFRPDPASPSIRECMSQLYATHTKLWELTEAALKHPADPGKKPSPPSLDDQLLLTKWNGVETVMSALGTIPSSRIDVDDLTSDYKKSVGSLIKFVRTSTDDMRHHLVQTPAGRLDAYQNMLLMSACTRSYIKKIESIKADPRFPR